jgi:hypothetical protein
MEVDGNGRRTSSAETGRRNGERLKYLTDRVDDDDGEKWATVSIYGLSSINFF